MFLLLVCGSLDWMKTDMIKIATKNQHFRRKETVARICAGDIFGIHNHHNADFNWECEIL